MHVTYYTAMSIDGRVAGPDDDLSFLEQSSGPSDWTDFIAGVDAVVVGASTVRWLVAGRHGWPHGDLPTWLVTHDDVLVASLAPTEQPLVQVQGDIGAAFDEIRAAGHEQVWLCGGGSVAAQALAVDAIDTIRATVIPAALGAGPALLEGAVGANGVGWRLDACEQVGSNARLTWRRLRD